ncbi:Predicted amidohydrolase [Tistlia consotensis]|uniref:Predicted amidohydrolase n=1 Tax=Tistlia consotensis USBA 355 TaxID=560819 RepID=A0A1Y6BS93_9PROT|nr:nitrilase-related carbon-nitrogen hydrolase [Tistlia consotensis]SMF25479.1 Predicted amidohydrolase [Tistlia consotensis USBA 355]SNR59293.1 Predicted amidohydrolase [Tistlia consotensis]
MSRSFVAAAAQLGPIERGAGRAAVVARLLALMREAKASNCRFVVFPEMALTTFFPRWLIDDPAEVAGYFEDSLPGPETQPLFDAARDWGVGFYLGYCERVPGREGADHLGFNTAVLVDQAGTIVGKYRKVHLPGNATYDPALKLQHLEPWYFLPGDLGFPVFEAFGGRLGLLLCNDRRWPESWRMLGLQGAELVALGYNSPAQLPDNPAQNALRKMHHLLPMQSAAYQNGTWVVAAAKAGPEGGCDMMGHSCVIAPSGEVVALSSGLGDELLPYRVDLDATAEYKRFFDFATYRRPECYGLLTEPHR